MLPLDACAGRADVGGKAETLARMRAAGLRVPDGLVLLPDEEVTAAALARELGRLGSARFAVRSSSPLEDRAHGSAAGLFESVVGVDALAAAAAVARVRSSASSPALTAYLTARELSSAGEGAALAVLIQPLIGAPTYGVAHSSADGFAVEERGAGEPEWGDVRARRIGRDDAGELAVGLRALEAIVGGAVDAEFARDGDTITWLQARPLHHAAAAREGSWTLAEAGRWRRDAEHNPDPLSAAQASLVLFVDGLGVGARQCVVGGYLYVASGAAPRGLSPLPVAALRHAFEHEIVPDCRRALDAAQLAGTLEAALAAFAHVYRQYVGRVSPSLAEVRHQLDRSLRDALGEPLALHGALLSGLGGQTLARDQALWEVGRAVRTLESYQREFGDHAPAWDVAVPTDRERPERVETLARELARAPSPAERHRLALQMAESARTVLVDRLPPSARAELVANLTIARDVLPIAEDDDLLFLRAQALVRRALLARAAALALDDGDDVFALSIEEVRAPPPDLAARVAVNRAARAAAARRVPPAAFDDGRPEWITPRARAVLRGHGTAGHARGRAVIVRALADAPLTLPPQTILIVPAIIPSLTPLLPQAIALITDHGGALSHGATLAREYGVPAVLGVAGATQLADGTELYVDADAGRVLILDRG